MSKARTLLLPLGLLLGFFLAAFDLWVGRAVVPWDAHDFFTPSFIALADFARSGHLMLWNPWMLGGIPDFAEPQLGAFSPLQLLIGLLFGGTLLGFRVYFIVIWGMSSLGIYLLGRQLRAPVWGSAMVAFNWLFSGFLLGHAEHVSWIYAMGCLPFVLLVLDQALLNGSWRRFAAAGAIWGASLLGGYPGIVFNNTLLIAGWAVGRVLSSRQSAATSGPTLARRAALTALGLAAMATVGCAVMAPNLAGMLVEAVGVTARAGAISRALAVGSNPLGGWCLSSLASPYLATPSFHSLWPQTDWSMASVYLGALTLTLAATALWPRTRSRACLLAGVIFLFLVSLGSATPLRGWLYDLVPFTRYFRHPAMYRGPAMFLVAVLALLGARDIESSTVPRWLPALMATGMTVVAVGILGLVSRGAGVPLSPQALQHMLFAWGGVLFGLWLYALATHRTQRWRTGAILVLALAVFLDGYFSDKISVTHAARGATPSGEALAMRRHRAGLDLATLSGLARVASIPDHLGVPPHSTWATALKIPVADGYTALRNSFQESMVEAPATRKVLVGSTKAWFSSVIVRAPPTARLFEAFMRRSAEAGSPPLVVHDADDFRRGRSATDEDVDTLKNLPTMTPLDARLIAYTPNRLELQLEAPRDGWLLVNDRWAAGWHAQINGQTSVVHPADFVFRAVAVKAGRNQVSFRYEPSTLPIALVLCWGTLAGVTLAQFRWNGLARLKRASRSEPGARA